MRTFSLRRGKRGVYTVTDAQRPMSEDIRYRQRRYLIMMGVRVAGLLLAVFLFHGVARFIAAGVAIVMPYFAVVFANGGREPDSGRRFQPYDPERTELPGPSSGSWDEPPEQDGGDQRGSRDRQDEAGKGGSPGQRGATDERGDPPGGRDFRRDGDDSLSGGEAGDPGGERPTRSNTA